MAKGREGTPTMSYRDSHQAVGILWKSTLVSLGCKLWSTGWRRAGSNLLALHSGNRERMLLSCVLRRSPPAGTDTSQSFPGQSAPHPAWSIAAFAPLAHPLSLREATI